MSKRISDLNEVKASRAKYLSQRNQPDPQRPRLAERLVALAPLARAPLLLEDDTDPHEAGLSRLADTHRFRQQTPAPSTQTRNALVPRSAASLPRAQDPVRLSRVGEAPGQFNFGNELSVRDGQGIAGFLVGLSIATAIGIALYVYLV